MLVGLRPHPFLVIHLETHGRFNRGHVSHHFVHAVGQKGANEKMGDRRFEKARRPRSLKLPPRGVGEQREPRLRIVIERQLRRSL